MTVLKSAAFAVSFAVLASGSVAETLRAEGGSAASLSALVPQLLAAYSDGTHDVRVNVDQTLTRAALKVATGAIDIASVPSGAYHRMTLGSGPYRELGDEAIAASANVRSLFSFAGGHVHPLVHSDSGIESWDDIEGMRVFVGPPAGAFSSQTTSLIRAITGYEEGEDYEAIRLAWSAANQAFEDGRFDVFLRSGTMGSAAIDQFGAASPFDLLGIPEEVIGTEAWEEFLTTPGYAADVLPAGTYENQGNNGEDQLLTAYVMFVAVNAEMSEQTAYDLTRAMFENIDQAHETNGGLSPLTVDNAFVSLAAPLHPGAIRYYEEAGVEIPEHLIPVE